MIEQLLSNKVMTVHLNPFLKIKKKKLRVPEEK